MNDQVAAKKPPRPVMLVVLDGFGWREDPADNAVSAAHTPAFDALWQTGPRAFLKTCGEDVGLPQGQMGNSEVGHLNIGAGRVVMQELPRISTGLADGSVAKGAVMRDFIAALKKAVAPAPDGPCLPRWRARPPGSCRSPCPHCARGRRARNLPYLYRWARHRTPVGA